VCDYVHLNPVRAGLLKAEDRLTAYPWSSLVWYAAAREHRPAWLRVDRLLGEHGIGEDSAAARAEFGAADEGRRAAEDDEETLAPIRRGWCLGSEAFRQEMLGRMEGQLGEHHAGDLRRSSPRAGPNGSWRRNCGAGMTESDLVGQPKRAAGKLGWQRG